MFEQALIAKKYEQIRMHQEQTNHRSMTGVFCIESSGYLIVPQLTRKISLCTDVSRYGLIKMLRYSIFIMVTSWSKPTQTIRLDSTLLNILRFNTQPDSMLRTVNRRGASMYRTYIDKQCNVVTYLWCGMEDVF